MNTATSFALNLAAAVLIAIASFVCPGTTHAQQSEPDAKAPKVTLKSVEAQVVTLQSQIATLQTTVNSLSGVEPQVVTLQGQVATLQTAVSSLFPEDFAVVASDGTLVRGSASAVSAANNALGKYAVHFNKDIDGCGYVATIGDTADVIPAPGEITVSSVGGNAGEVAVDTYDNTGTPLASSFHLFVSCP